MSDTIVTEKPLLEETSEYIHEIWRFNKLVTELNRHYEELQDFDNANWREIPEQKRLRMHEAAAQHRDIIETLRREHDAEGKAE